MKRFTATEIWQKPWFRKSPCRLKCLWRYLCDHCDAAGVWEPDWELASIYVGEPVSEADLSAFNGNAVIRNGNVYLPQFIEFQYGRLSKDCKPHEKVFEAMDRHGISLLDAFPKGNGSLSPRVSITLQEEEEEEEEDKKRKKTAVSSVAQRVTPDESAEIPTVEEIVAYGQIIGATPTTCKDLFDYHQSKNLWKNQHGRMIDWKHTLAVWRDRNRADTSHLTPKPVEARPVKPLDEFKNPLFRAMVEAARK